MTKFCIAVLLMCISFCNAQVVKNVGDFTEIKSAKGIKITLIPSDEAKVEIREVDEKSISLVNKKGRLVVKNTIKELIDGNTDIYVKVFYKNLEKIDAESGSLIENEKVFKTESIKISAKLGGHIRLKQMNAQEIIASLHTGGQITLSGTTEKLDVVNNSGSIFESRDLNAQKVEATINAGGTIDVKAIKSIIATTRAGGVITIYGNPEIVKEKTTAGGVIKKK